MLRSRQATMAVRAFGAKLAAASTSLYGFFRCLGRADHHEGTQRHQESNHGGAVHPVSPRQGARLGPIRPVAFHRKNQFTI